MNALVFMVVFLVLAVDARGDETIEAHQTNGAELFGLVDSKTRFKLRSLDNDRELKRALSEQQCDGIRYQYYKLGEFVYVIGSSRRGVVIGRHFKFRVDGDMADISSITASTNGCLVLGNNPNAVALTVTHSLTETPTEFHVLASMLSGKPIYVLTGPEGIWEVSGDSIEKVER